MNSKQPLNIEIDHLFRQEYSKIVALLVSKFGQSNIEEIEDSVQNSLVKASQQWAFGQIPDNKTAWLYQVAKNNLLDQLRRQNRIRSRSEDLTEKTYVYHENENFLEPLADSLLQMIFITCQPSLSRDARIALTLKVMCGLSVNEIADAFLMPAETIFQRLLRAKNKLKQDNFKIEDLVDDELNERLDDVLDVIYFMFNEGYHSYSDKSLIRDDLCSEALRLIDILRSHKRTSKAKVYALNALMLFQASRLQSRLGEDSAIILLEDQDRKKWNRQYIAQGIEYLNQASGGDELTSFHIQAGIASLHCTSTSVEQTDWEKIRTLYDLLLHIENNPVVKLNRTVAIAMIDGPEQAIQELNQLKHESQLKDYIYLDLLYADFYKRKGDQKKAKNHYSTALTKTRSSVIQKMIQKKISDLDSVRSNLVKKNDSP